MVHLNTKNDKSPLKSELEKVVTSWHSDQNVRKAPDQATYIEYGEASLENVKV